MDFSHFANSINSGENWVVIGNNSSGKSRVGEIINKEKKNSSLFSLEKIEEILEEERKKDQSDDLNMEDPGTLVKEFLTGAPLVFDIEAIKERGLKFLSTGEMVKVLIIKELMDSPETIILDEPFEGLDRDSIEIVKNIITRLSNSNMSVILILTRERDIPENFKNISFIHNFRVLLKGNREEVLNNESFRLLRHFSRKLPSKLPGEPKARSKSPRLIEINSMDLSYGETRVLKELTWKVDRGEHYKITGPNGSGKSSLLKIISADSNQSYGKDITLFGIKRGSGESIWDIKKHVGLVSSSLQKDYRVSVTLESVIVSGFYDSIGLYSKPSNKEIELAENWLKIGGLYQKRKATFKSLSYGEQRVGLILRSLVKHPEVLILDEPCLGLDEINCEMVLSLIEMLINVGETTILYVSHRREDRIPSIKKELILTPGEDGSRGRVIEV